MTDLITELESMARQSNDAAASCEAAAERHRPEFERNVHVDPPDATAETHARAVELYQHVIGSEHEASRLRREAEVLRAAVAALRRYREALTRTSNLNNGPDLASASYRCEEAAVIATEALKEEPAP